MPARPARGTPPARPDAPRGLSARLRTALCRGEDDADVRGYRLSEAASGGTFLEVAFLLIHGGLPDQDRLADFRALLLEAAEVPPPIRALTAELPLHVTPGQTVRTVVSLLGEFSESAGQTDPAAVRGQAVELMARLPLVFATAKSGKAVKRPAARGELSYGADLVRLLSGSAPTDEEEVAFEADMTLAADPAPRPDVLAARLAAARGADLFGVVTAALCRGDGPPPADDPDEVPAEPEREKKTPPAAEDVRAAVARCVARVPVWAAHAIEQRDQLFDAGVETSAIYDRPPERLYEPLAER